VEDFLKALNKNPDDLSKVNNIYSDVSLVLVVNLCWICVLMSPSLGLQVLQMKRQCNSWLKLTKHAREYILEDPQELKPYISEDRSVMLLFNCVYDLVGAMFDGVGYVASEIFDSSQKVHAESRS
jgi:hypothetical protein